MAIDYELAKDLNVAVGDRIRITSSAGAIGCAADDRRHLAARTRTRRRLCTLRTGQSLFGVGIPSTSVILVKVFDISKSNEVADRIESLVPYEARSWLREYPSFVSSLTVQGRPRISFRFSGFIASSFAIASVLIVSVLQKSQQIGILKSIEPNGVRYSQFFVLRDWA